MSVPAGLNREGLPLGLQLIGRPFDEQGVLNAGLAIEQRAGFAARPEQVVVSEVPDHRDWLTWAALALRLLCIACVSLAICRLQAKSRATSIIFAHLRLIGHMRV